VRCLVRPLRIDLGWLGGLPVEIVQGDLLSPDSIASSLRGVDYIIHIAGITKAKRKSDYFNGNVLATRNLLELASNIPSLKTFCHLSSLTAVGPSPDGNPLAEHAPCNPITAYGLSKLEGEHICLEYMDKLPITILRPPAVYGPRDKDILELFKAAHRGFHPIIGSRNKTASLIYGPDLAKGIVEATLSKKTLGQSYFISDHSVYDYETLFSHLARIVGRSLREIRLPSPLFYTVAGFTELVSLFGSRPAVLSIDKARDLLQRHWVCDPTKIKNDLGFTTPTSIEAGLRQAYHWYIDNHWI
jgi:dihydroflavonol-4-reductase